MIVDKKWPEKDVKSGMKRENWYFRGYQRVEEPRKGGSGTRLRLVYTGEWYGFPHGKTQQRRVKLSCGLLTALMLGAYLFAQLHPGLGGRIGWLAATSMLAMLPMMVEVAAFFNFLPAKEKWEYRVYYGGYRRMRYSGWALTCFLLVWLGMELWFLLQFSEWWKVEFPYLLSILIALAAQGGMMAVISRNPVCVLEEGGS